MFRLSSTGCARENVEVPGTVCRYTRGYVYIILYTCAVVVAVSARALEQDEKDGGAQSSVDWAMDDGTASGGGGKESCL